VVTQADVDAGNIHNVGTANSEETDPAEDPEDVPVPQNPAIELVKTGVFNDGNGDGFADVGETISYSFTVRNIGNVTLREVTVIDLRIAVNGEPLAELAVGASDMTTFTGSYVVTQDDIDTGKVDNLATATGKDPQDNPVEDTDLHNQPLPQNPALTLIKSAFPTSYSSAGQVINYNYLVTNSGNVTINQPITVTDDKATASCPAEPAGLAPGESMTCTADYTIVQGDLDSGSVTNVAYATGKAPNDPESDITSATDTETVTAGELVTRTQGFWSTHPTLAQIAWDGGSGFDHTFPGVSAVSIIGDQLICGRPVTSVMEPGSNQLMGGFWSDVAKESDKENRSALDQARMQLLQQLLAAELNASAFGSIPIGGSGKFDEWEGVLCGTDKAAILMAVEQATWFNESGDSGTFTPGTSAKRKYAKKIADIPFWDTVSP
jgi:hypothetical protein